MSLTIERDRYLFTFAPNVLKFKKYRTKTATKTLYRGVSTAPALHNAFTYRVEWNEVLDIELLYVVAVLLIYSDLLLHRGRVNFHCSIEGLVRAPLTQGPHYVLTTSNPSCHHS